MAHLLLPHTSGGKSKRGQYETVVGYGWAGHKKQAEQRDSSEEGVGVGMRGRGGAGERATPKRAGYSPRSLAGIGVALGTRSQHGM